MGRFFTFFYRRSLLGETGEFLRFVSAGAVNAGFSSGLYALFLWLGLDFALANLISFVISLLFSVRTQGGLEFRHHDCRLLWRFVAAWVLIYLFNVGLIAILVCLPMSAYLAGALALVPVTLLSYLVQELVVFGASRSGADASSVRPTP